MSKRVSLARVRVREGFWNDVIDGAWERYKAGGRESVRDALSQELLDRALARYGDKIRAMFARGGLPIDPETPITVEVLTELIKDRTGLPLTELTPAAVSSAVDQDLAGRLSEALQVSISSVFDKERLKEELKSEIRKIIADGRGASLLTKAMVKTARSYATWKRHGVEGMEKQRIQNRAYQARYRQSYKLVWD